MNETNEANEANEADEADQVDQAGGTGDDGAPTPEGQQLAELRAEVDQAETRVARTVELGGRAVVIAVAVFVLIVGLILPWMGEAGGLDVLLGQGDAAGRGGMIPRLFVITAALFGVLTSALVLITRRWALAWVGALGGWFASVDGVLAIWSRQSMERDVGIGLVIAAIAMIVIAYHWFRVAWSRT